MVCHMWWSYRWCVIFGSLTDGVLYLVVLQMVCHIWWSYRWCVIFGGLTDGV